MSTSALFKKLLIIPGVALGVLALLFLVKSRQEPLRSEIQEVARSVRIIAAPEIAIVPRALGYGMVQAGQTWEAVAEVAGKVVEIHPKLKKGALLRQGDVLLRIDPAEYGLAKIRAQAEIENLEAKLNELKQNERDIRRSLDVEKRSLGISRQELERRQRLFVKGTISKSELEQEEKRILTQQNAVQNLQTALNRMPSQGKAIQAQIASSRANLEGTGLDIQKTTIRVPFDFRISESNVELAQFVSIGKVLLKADNIGFIMKSFPGRRCRQRFYPHRDIHTVAAGGGG
jgi:multidrug efflux pump subunit AcrA (membrane-fusion protein)